MGCPKKYKNKKVTRVSGNSKHDVRCCSPLGDSCTSKPCQKAKTYQEAAEICSSKGLRLCFPDELNKCCSTGCKFDFSTVWVATKAPGNNPSYFNMDSAMLLLNFQSLHLDRNLVTIEFIHRKPAGGF